MVEAADVPHRFMHHIGSKCRITAASVSQGLVLKSLGTYVVKRQLQWARRHVARMEFTHGGGLEFALNYDEAKVNHRWNMLRRRGTGRLCSGR